MLYKTLVLTLLIGLSLNFPSFAQKISIQAPPLWASDGYIKYNVTEKNGAYSLEGGEQGLIKIEQWTESSKSVSIETCNEKIYVELLYFPGRINYYLLKDVYKIHVQRYDDDYAIFIDVFYGHSDKYSNPIGKNNFISEEKSKTAGFVCDVGSGLASIGEYYVRYKEGAPKELVIDIKTFSTDKKSGRNLVRFVRNTDGDVYAYPLRGVCYDSPYYKGYAEFVKSNGVVPSMKGCKMTPEVVKDLGI